jgi:epoxyqueuosine reductase
MIRNALIAAGNSGDPRLAPLVQDLLADENPVVRDAADWALSRLGAPS